MNGNKVALFEEKEIRKTWHNDEWYFSVEDVVFCLTETVNAKDYIKKMRKRDGFLSINWGTICPLVEMLAKDGKKRKIMSSNTKGILRIIQSIPSKKAEVFKLWLAEVGNERIEEINNPELAVERARKIYDKKGYDSSWASRRLKGMASRIDLTEEWKNRGVDQNKDYAILTNEIYKNSFDMTARELRDYKNVNDRVNLRDSFNEVELVLTDLAEITAKEIHKAKDSQGFNKLKDDAKEAGTVAKNARLDIESRTGKKAISNSNFIDLTRNN